MNNKMNNMYSVHVKIFINFQDKILILKQKRNSKWHLPGGNLEKNEAFENACRREVQEECSINLSDLKYLYSENFEFKKVQYVRVQFEAKTNSDEINLSEEHNDFAWLLKQELDKYDFAYGEKERLMKYF